MSLYHEGPVGETGEGEPESMLPENRGPSRMPRGPRDVRTFSVPTPLRLFEAAMDSELPTLLPVHNAAQPHCGLHLLNMP